jgi:hypothetical protein
MNSLKKTNSVSSSSNLLKKVKRSASANDGNEQEWEATSSGEESFLSSSIDVAKYVLHDEFDDWSATVEAVALLKQCALNSVCRSCARCADGLFVSAEKLKAVVLKALNDRKKCLSDHPLYNIAESKQSSHAKKSKININAVKRLRNQLNYFE